MFFFELRQGFDRFGFADDTRNRPSARGIDRLALRAGLRLPHGSVGRVDDADCFNVRVALVLNELAGVIDRLLGGVSWHVINNVAHGGGIDWAQKQVVDAVVHDWLRGVTREPDRAD